MPFIVVRAERERIVGYGHPWIFSRGIEKVSGSPASGETVDILAPDGSFLGRGAFSPHSQIAVRLWTVRADEEVTPAFLRGRLSRAIQARKTRLEGPQTGARVIYSESDGLPGLIVDRYGDFLVCQFLSAGAEHWKSTFVALMDELLCNRGIFERSDGDVREKEGLARQVGVLSGEAPPDTVEIHEGPCRFLVDIKEGHKTGFYLDQRENRCRVASYAPGMQVLDCFSYTGAFSVAALQAGADEVVMVDESLPALRLAGQNIALNSLDQAKVQTVEGSVPHVLRGFRDSRRSFDVIILDPPKFAKSRGHLDDARRGYKDINVLAMKLLRPGGFLASFSCSQLVSPDLFQRTLAYAALDAQRHVQILERLFQAPDHPTALNFPEASYLKGLICQVW